MRLVVMKLGGSLLSSPDLASRVRHLLSLVDGSRVLIVVGGGPAADVVRDWSQIYSLSEEASHWLALRSLSTTRALVLQLLPECLEIRTRDEAQQHWERGLIPLLLDVESYLRQVESPGRPVLPHRWDVTSDSISAWVATHWMADELILLKSIELNPNTSTEDAVQAGLVDVHFPVIASQVSSISWCNLLNDPIEIELWKGL